MGMEAIWGAGKEAVPEGRMEVVELAEMLGEARRQR